MCLWSTSAFSICDIQYLWYLTTVVLIGLIPTVITEVTHLGVLHTHIIVAQERTLWTQGLGLCRGNQTIFHEYKSAWKKEAKWKKKSSGILPGRVQLVKSMSSMATCPGVLKVLEASKRMEKSWETRSTVTSPRCHTFPRLPDSHHSVVVLELSFNTTFSSSVSETVCSDKDRRRNTHADSYILFKGCTHTCAYNTHTLSIHVVIEV